MNKNITFYKRKKVQGINLIPLINVIFLLLVFFMVAGRVEGVDTIPVEVPESIKATAKPSEAITIYLSNHNGEPKFAVNKDIIRRKDLPDVIDVLLLEDGEREIILKSDRNVVAKELIEIMRIIEKSGGKYLLLAAEVK